jgi:hypothetical protein
VPPRLIRTTDDGPFKGMIVARLDHATVVHGVGILTSAQPGDYNGPGLSVRAGWLTKNPDKWEPADDLDLASVR